MGFSLTSNGSGYAACLLVVLIWVFWLLISRVGVTTSFTAYDLAAMRYGISAIISLPFVIYFKPWRSLPVKRAIIMSIVLGPVYILTVFSGFTYAPAAHGGIFMNGLMPIFALIFSWLFLSAAIELHKLLGAVLILMSAVILGLSTTDTTLAQSWVGDLYFTVGGLFFAVFVTLSRMWHIQTLDILFCGSLVNAVIYLPIWFLFLPHGFQTADSSMLILQCAYQGLIPNLIGLVLIAHAAKTIGTDVTAAFMAAVPGFGAFLGVILLSENLSTRSWIAILGMTLGLLIITLKRSSFRQS